MKCIVCQRSETTENGSPNEVCLPAETNGNEIWGRGEVARGQRKHHPPLPRLLTVSSFLSFSLSLSLARSISKSALRARIRRKFCGWKEILHDFLSSSSFFPFITFKRIISINSHKFEGLFEEFVQYYIIVKLYPMKHLPKLYNKREIKIIIK